MGACSSKPKTTEFEGSTEPSKQTEDVVADRSLNALEAAQTPQPNEPSKQEVGAAEVDTETVQETRELVASKDEEPLINKDEDPLIKGLSSTEEGLSHGVKAETGVVDEAAGDNTAEKCEVDAGGVQKADEGVVAADIKEVSDKATTAGEGVGGDQDKLFEDKAVVLDEAGVGSAGGEDAYIDKGVAADEEKEQDSATVTTLDEQSKNVQDIHEPPGAESPIIGVVQPGDPVHADDVAESVDLATLETPVHVDSTVSESTVSESPVEIKRDVSIGTDAGGDAITLTEDRVNLSSSGLPQELPEETEQVLHDTSKEMPLLDSVSDDGVGQESGADDTLREETPLASADAQGETSVDDSSKAETVNDSQNDINQGISEPQEENAVGVNPKESHAEVTENEGIAEVVDEPEPEALKVIEGIDAETSTEPKAETTLAGASEGHDEGIVVEPIAKDVQPQSLAVEETATDGKPEATPYEAVAEPSAGSDNEKTVADPHIEEAATNKQKAGSVEAGNRELSLEQAKNGFGEGDLAFEDASDAPLKAESSTTESGHTPNS